MGKMDQLVRPAARAEYRMLDNTTFRIGQLAGSYNRSASRFYAKHFGLSTPEVRVLNVVGHHEPVAAADVVDISLTDKALVSRAVAKLIKLGLLVRGSDDLDGRRLILTLTEAGRATWSEVLAAKKRRYDRSLSSLTAGEVEQLNELLARLEADALQIEREEMAAAP